MYSSVSYLSVAHHTTFVHSLKLFSQNAKGLLVPFGTHGHWRRRESPSMSTVSPDHSCIKFRIIPLSLSWINKVSDTLVGQPLLKTFPRAPREIAQKVEIIGPDLIPGTILDIPTQLDPGKVLEYHLVRPKTSKQNPFPMSNSCWFELVC